MGPITWIKRHHNVLSYIIPLHNSLISRSFLMVSLIAFLSLPLPLVIRLLSDLPLIYYSPCYKINTSSLYMPKSPKSSFYHFSTIGVVLPQLSLSNIVIFNSIMFSFTTHPTQHLHLCYAYFTSKNERLVQVNDNLVSK